MKKTNLKLKEYFLETLTTQEVKNIDLRIIADAEFAEEMEMMETGLMEDYLEKTLSAEEMRLFETKFLITEERLERLEFLRSLKQIAQTSLQESDVWEVRRGFFSLLKNFFSPRKFVLALGLIIVVATLGIIWKVILPTNQFDSDLAVMNRKDLSNPDEFKNSTNLSLTSGSLRSGGNSNLLNSTDLSENVFLRLVLPANTPLDSTFQVKLRRDKNIISGLDKTKIYGTGTTREFRLLVPAAILKKGEYEIELHKENAKDEKIVYVFIVR